MAVRAAIIGGLVWAALLGMIARADGPPVSLPVSDDPSNLPDAPPPLPPPADDWPRTSFQPPATGPQLAPAPGNQFSEPPISPFLPRAPIDPGATRINLPVGGRQRVEFSPRYERPYNSTGGPLPEDPETNRAVITGGVIVRVIYLGNSNGTMSEVEFATDNAVVWVTGLKGKDPTRGIETETDGGKGKVKVELYMTGDVVIRTSSPGSGGTNVEQVLRSEEVYYEVNRNKAVALCADLETRGTSLPDSVHLRSKEIWRLGKNEWKAFDTLVSASKRPSDPNLTFQSKESTLTTARGAKRNFLGIKYRNLKTGEVDEGYERILTSKWSTARILNVPIWVSPWSETDLSEPLGPLIGVGMGNDTIFGFQLYTTWDMNKILAFRPPTGHRWLLDLDYMSDRGPGYGTLYTYNNLDFFGYGGPNSGMFKFYGVADGADEDTLGGYRGTQPDKPYSRYRMLLRHNQEIYENSTTWLRYQAQAAYLTDKNYLEQYFKLEFDQGPNQETFSYLHGAMGNFWGSFWIEGNMNRQWVTETEWLPRADGAIIGESLLNDWFVYTARGSAGYAKLKPTEDDPVAVLPTDAIRIDAGRFDLFQRLSAPFDAGPIRFDPYGVMDLAYYSRSLNQQPIGGGAIGGPNQLGAMPASYYDTTAADGLGRFYGGGGVTASTTFSRIYQDACSELFNVRGLNHKVTFEANYFASYSNTPYTSLPQFDRMFDDATDQGYRNSRPNQIQMLPNNGGAYALQTSPLFDPQQYAIRRLVDDRPDTLDGTQILQTAVNQRLQTKRGFPGNEHTVDWMTLNMSASYFPDPQKDNYGQSWSFLEYYYQWHIGDRFSVSSGAWVDPVENGAKYYNVGINFNRPDGTNFYFSYRHTDPLNSRAVVAMVNYKMSSKYSVFLSTSYDFGMNEALSNSVSISRVGTDMTTMFGFTYNALVNNFGLQFSLLPNAAGASKGQFLTNQMTNGR